MTETPNEYEFTLKQDRGVGSSAQVVQMGAELMLIALGAHPEATISICELNSEGRDGRDGWDGWAIAVHGGAKTPPEIAQKTREFVQFLQSFEGQTYVAEIESD